MFTYNVNCYNADDLFKIEHWVRLGGLSEETTEEIWIMLFFKGLWEGLTLAAAICAIAST